MKDTQTDGSPQNATEGGKATVRRIRAGICAQDGDDVHVRTSRTSVWQLHFEYARDVPNNSFTWTLCAHGQLASVTQNIRVGHRGPRPPPSTKEDRRRRTLQFNLYYLVLYRFKLGSSHFRNI